MFDEKNNTYNARNAVAYLMKTKKDEVLPHVNWQHTRPTMCLSCPWQDVQLPVRFPCWTPEQWLTVGLSAIQGAVTWPGFCASA